MLRLLLDECGGALPGDVVPVFANTGEEAEGTLIFIREMAERWGVLIRWVEFTRDAPHWREVDYCSASRRGEPFDTLVDWKSYLPNATERICTEWLKVRPVELFAASIGLPGVDRMLGIRADEPRRVAKNRAKDDIFLPLADRGVTQEDVLAFWREQPFNLQIRAGEGNCRLCYLKGQAQLRNVARGGGPDEAGLQRWIDREQRVGATMRRRDPYRRIADHVRRQLPMFDAEIEEDPDLLPCACGD